MTDVKEPGMKFKDTFVEIDAQIPVYNIESSADPNSDLWQHAQELEDHIFVDIMGYNPTVEHLHEYYGRYTERTTIISGETTNRMGNAISISSIRLIQSPDDESDISPEGRFTLPTIDDVGNGKLFVFGEDEKILLRELYATGQIAEGGTIAKPPSSELAQSLGISEEQAKQLKGNLNVELFNEMIILCRQKGIKYILAATDVGYFEMLNNMFAGKKIVTQLGPPTGIYGGDVIVTIFDVEVSIVNFGIE